MVVVPDIDVGAKLSAFTVKVTSLVPPQPSVYLIVTDVAVDTFAGV
jgi:hypothetical protein